MADNFNVWAVKPRTWRKKDGRTYNGWSIDGWAYIEGDAPRKVAGPFEEPAEAADVAEEYLTDWGTPGVSYMEIRYNGDTEPHTLIFMLEDSTVEHAVFGVWNSDSARWPMYYPESPYGVMLDGYPEGFEPEEADEGENKRNEEADTMDLSDDGSDEEDDFTDEEDDEDDGAKEVEEEDSGEDEEDDFSDDDQPEPEEAEDEDVDEEDEDSDDNESSDPDDADDETDDGSDDEEEADDDENDDELEDDEEEETELPRLKLFAKMRGPLGWRKRAELVDLNERNVWALKVGVLDEEADKPAKQEANVFMHIEFIEKDEDHKTGTLRIKLPEGITLDDFNMTKAGWLTTTIPLPHEEN